MSGSRNQFVILAGIGILGIALYAANSHNSGEHRAKSHGQSIDTEGSETNAREFAGYECTVDCSGHEVSEMLNEIKCLDTVD